MKRAYCLYRVSTKNQVDVQKDDIPMQKIACHEFANAHGWVIAKEFSEKGVSGFKVSADERDAIQSLKTAALMVYTSYNSKYIRKDGNVSEYHTKKYMYYHRARKLNDCSSQISYDAYKIDNAITEIVEKIFQNIVETPETEIISKRLESELTTAKPCRKNISCPLKN